MAYSPGYHVTYRYSAEAKGWLRFVNGRAALERATGRQLVAANVIVQYAPHRDLRDKDGHLAIELVGRGKAEYFLGSAYGSGEWEKCGLEAPTVFRDTQGQPIRPARGSTWVEIVRPQVEVARAR